MADEEQIIQTLKEKRRTQKSQVSSLSRQLSTSNSYDKTLITDIYSKLQTAFSNFNDVHFEYAELVLSDDKFEAYRTVHGLSLDEYVSGVEKTYQEACLVYNQKAVKFFEHDMQLARKTAASLEHASQSIIDNHITMCKELSDNFFALTNSCNEDIQGVIIALKSLSAKVTEVRGYNPINQSTGAVASAGGAPSAEVGSIGRESANEGGGLASSSGVQIGENQSDHNSVQVDDSVSNVDVVRGGGLVRQNVPTSAQLPANQVNSTSEKLSMPATVASISSASPLLSVHKSNSVEQNSIVAAYADRRSNGPTSLPVVSPQPGSNVSIHSHKYKKRDPPSFDGTPRDWPEFRSVWRRYAMSEFVDDEQRASA